MSNSSLVTYKAISPNCTKPRRGTIKHIVIHHMAGNLSVETCGQVFAPVSRQASSHYGIGSDGRIGQYCYEENRAWTTGGAIDHESVTIEVADDKMGSPWHSSPKAMAALIKLCADICKRNGITRCTYTGSGSGTLLKHQWYQSTDCPGAWLGSQFSYIATEVNKLLSGEGWVKDAKGWKYKTNSGYVTSQWLKLDAWYYFGADGYAYANKWTKYKEVWYYFGDDCRMVVGKWILYKNKWYYLEKDGSMVIGWLSKNNEWYYMDLVNGDMKTGFVKDGEHTYYLRPKKDGTHPEGSMVTGWLKLNNIWYYFAPAKAEGHPKGSMYENEWIEYKGKKYYLKEKGEMACNEHLTLDGKAYSFDASGASI